MSSLLRSDNRKKKLTQGVSVKYNVIRNNLSIIFQLFNEKAYCNVGAKNHGSYRNGKECHLVELPLNYSPQIKAWILSFTFHASYLISQIYLIITMQGFPP